MTNDYKRYNKSYEKQYHDDMQKGKYRGSRIGMWNAIGGA